MIDLNGKLLFELLTTDKNLAPISNIEINNLVYLSINGIVEVNIETKKMELIIPYKSEPDGMEQNQINILNKTKTSPMYFGLVLYQP